MPAPRVPKHVLSAWVRPLAEVTAAPLSGADAPVVVEALLAVGAAYAYVSEQTGADFELWGREAWDRCFNLPEIPNLQRTKTCFVYPATLSPAAEVLADSWVETLLERKNLWASMGSPWGDEIASSQVGSFALLMGARAAQRTATGFSPWVRALRDAWERRLFDLEVRAP